MKEIKFDKSIEVTQEKYKKLVSISSANLYNDMENDYLILTINNFYKEVLMNFTFEVIQKDVNNKELKREIIEAKNLFIKKRSSAKYDKLIDADKNLNHLEINIIRCEFTSIVFDNGRIENNSKEKAKKLDKTTLIKSSNSLNFKAITFIFIALLICVILIVISYAILSNLLIDEILK